ncbi:MAG: TlyA family RNA methyltransferase [Acidobacteria bacterium]|nr:TlyA family RNA methyltransferase [Acidobacteriota bacterium]
MKPPGRRRLDHLLVERGLADTRTKAQALILAGQVLVDGRRADKAGQAVPAASQVRVLERMPYVSRGGFKLAAALDGFGIRVEGRVCADVGASTGGFTDCLLQRGARRVYAVDVGAGQLDWRLRNDPRVVVKEGLNARHLRLEDLGEGVDLGVCDVSFISATLILPALVEVLKPDGEMVILVKPQFEAGRGQVGKGGIVRAPAVRQAACARVEEAARRLGFETSLMESPLPGAEGNVEFLLYARH